MKRLDATQDRDDTLQETPKLLTEEAAQRLARAVSEIFYPATVWGEPAVSDTHDWTTRPRAEDGAVKRKRIKRKKAQKQARRKQRPHKRRKR